MKIINDGVVGLSHRLAPEAEAAPDRPTQPRNSRNDQPDHYREKTL
ncbi:MAG: hypothetical protein LBR20_07070 [Propionibacteriaceae bacterium]|jgi:hypothetical protein|nr:hypothetical protein [Propionibacteriaceae bacterium]